MRCSIARKKKKYKIRTAISYSLFSMTIQMYRRLKWRSQTANINMSVRFVNGSLILFEINVNSWKNKCLFSKKQIEFQGFFEIQKAWKYYFSVGVSNLKTGFLWLGLVILSDVFRGIGHMPIGRYLHEWPFTYDSIVLSHMKLKNGLLSTDAKLPTLKVQIKTHMTDSTENVRQNYFYGFFRRFQRFFKNSWKLVYLIVEGPEKNVEQRSEKEIRRSLVLLYEEKMVSFKLAW